MFQPANVAHALSATDNIQAMVIQYCVYPPQQTWRASGAGIGTNPFILLPKPHMHGYCHADPSAGALAVCRPPLKQLGGDRSAWSWRKKEGGGAYTATAGKRKSGQLSFIFLRWLIKTSFLHIIGVYYPCFFLV